MNNDHFIDYALNHGFGDVHVKVDKDLGFCAIIAIHSTQRGPALGGCRFIEYPDYSTALLDAMRLARGMSYKNASVNLPLGGGKSVIIKPKGSFDRAAYFKRFGEFVQELGGRYITALDSGTLLSDMDMIAEQTNYVASLSKHHGDPSPSTAQGVLHGIEAAVHYKLGKNSLEGLHVAIQGLGHVGYDLAHRLHQLGARLTVADLDLARVEDVVRTLGAQRMPTEKIHTTECDVFAPCALGAVLNDKTIKELQTSIVAGAANNQLEQSYHGQHLHDRGILYAPDYVINAGGVIFAANKYFHKSEHELHQQLDAIPTSLLEIFKRSTLENRPTNELADILAEEKLK
ncbi:MAG: Leu/Phe/Val dehydrogenase [Legionellaceae bacterium]